jgi:hypothetical protein
LENKILFILGPPVGDQVITPPAMVAINGRVSILQIRVSLNGRLSKGLSKMVNVLVSESVHPYELVFEQRQR